MNWIAFIMGNGLENEQSPIIPERPEAIADESDIDNYGRNP